MDPDLEFNTLCAVSQSVISDIKNSHPAWDVVNQKALKLAASLRSTVQCLSGFIDAVQTVSDLANNLKGATRDIGACMTRVCMRERVLETRLRAVADSLSEQLAVTVQGKSTFWKQRTQELEKVCAKHAKKARARKQQPLDPSTLAEQRELCAQVLAEQRSQFAFFVGAIMSFFSTEIATLEEGANIRQVAESLESTLQHVDSSSLVASIITDISQGSEGAWRRCLDTATKSFLAQEAVFGGTSNYSSNDIAYGSRATTPACSDSNGVYKRPSTLAGLHFVQPQQPSNGEHYNGQPQIGKPPLQRKSSEKSLNKTSLSSPTEEPGNDLRMAQMPTARSHNYMNGKSSIVYPRPSNGFAGTPMCSYAPTSSSASSSEAPSSAAFIAETIQQIDQLGSDLDAYCLATDHQQMMQYMGKTMNNNNNNNSNAVNGVHNGETPTCEEERRYSHPAQLQLQQPAQPPASLLLDYATVNVSTFYNQPGNGTAVSGSTMRPAMGAATIPRPPSAGAQSAPAPSLSHHGGSMSSVNTAHLSNGLRFRENSSRPPPPVRRSSQITAATPTAPSVAEARMSMSSSIMGSRQSLNSASLYSQLGSQQDVRYAANGGSLANPAHLPGIPPSSYSYGLPGQARAQAHAAAANYKI